MLRFFFFAVIFTLNNLLVFSQIKKLGTPYIRNYTKKEYRAGSQNWSIAQDKRGIMYFANTRGLLEFDGSKWQLYTLPNSSIVKSIVLGNKGRIYVGGYNEFGYFFPDNQGILRYHSLLKKLDQANREFGEILNIHETHYGIVFQSFSTVIVCKDTLSAKIILYNSNLNSSYYINKILYISNNNEGLLKYDGTIFKLVIGGDSFVNKKIVSLLPYERNKLLIVTSLDGLFILDQFGIESIKGRVNDFSIENQANCGLKIDNSYAIGTANNGIIFFDQEAQPIQHLSKKRGLQNISILSSFVDNDKNLWLGLTNGIDYVKTNSPVTYINDKQYIGTPYSSAYFNDNLYLATSKGLFYRSKISIENPFSQDEFKLVENIRDNVWSVSMHENKLICGGQTGTFEINDNKATQICAENGGFEYVQFPERPDIMIGGMEHGLALFFKGIEKDTGWHFAKMFEGFHESAKELEIDREGYLWVSNLYKGVYKILLNESLDTITSVNFYNNKKGLPSDYFNEIFTFNNNIYVSSEYGIYEYVFEPDSFKKSIALSQLLGGGRIEKLFEDPNGSKWYFQNQELKVLRLNYNSNYSIERVPLGLYKGSFLPNFESINFIDNNNILISTDEAFVHFSPTLIKREPSNYTILIRMVKGYRDSVLFGGNFVNDGIITLNRRPDQFVNLEYKHNSIKIEYTDNSYEENQPVMYRSYLEGYDLGWGDWSNDKIKYYNLLREGKYIFHLKGKCYDGAETNEATFGFVILPPWYRSLYAYIGYLLLSIAFFFFVTRGIQKRVERKKYALLSQHQAELLKHRNNFEKESSIAHEEIKKLQNEKGLLEHERIKENLEWKSRELASFAMHLTYLNEILARVRDKIAEVINRMKHEDSKKQLSLIVSSIEKEMEQEENWEKFEYHFDLVHKDFMKKLKSNFPDLTYKDLRLAAYLRMDLSTKEIASLLNISIRGVEISRYRLRKKLDIDRNLTFNDFFMNM